MITYLCSIIAFVLSAGYIILRQGFEINLADVTHVLGLSLFLVCVPEGVYSLLKNTYFAKKNFFFSLPIIALAIFCLVLISGITASFLKFDFARIFSFLGFLAFLEQFCELIAKQRKHILPLFILTLLFVLFAVWLMAVIWGSGFQNPLFIENIIAGSTYQDSLFHASIIQMIRTYGTPSTGLNGIPYLPYHWGSHWVFAQFSNLLKINPLVFIQLAYPIIFLPLFFYYFLSGVCAYQKMMNLRFDFNFCFFLILIIATVGFWPMAYVGILELFIFFSESYLLAMMFSFLLFAIIFISIKNNYWKISPIFLILALFFFIGLLKITVFLLLFAAWIYLFVRLKLYLTKTYRLVFLATLLSALLIFILSSNKYHVVNFQIYFMHFLKTSVNSPWKPFFPILNYFWVFVYSFFKLRVLRIKTLTNLKNAYLSRKIIDIEILLILSFLGFLPGALISIPAGGAFYFADINRW
jgi:hypothetical protein